MGAQWLSGRVLDSRPKGRGFFMQLSPLLMEIWSFEIIHCLNFNTQGQKRHDVTNDVKVEFLICGLVCMKNMLFLANIPFFIILSMCAMVFAEKLSPIHFCLEFA